MDEWTSGRAMRWAGRGLTGAAVAAMSLGIAGGGAGAQTATPRFYGTPACTTDLPYEVDLHIADFPPNGVFRMIIGYYWEGDEFVANFPGPDIRTDANGDADEAGIDLIGDQPHRIGGFFYRDTNENNRWNEGEEVIADLIMSIDQPCTGAEASPK
jgi:hypothetical protein